MKDSVKVISFSLLMVVVMFSIVYFHNKTYHEKKAEIFNRITGQNISPEDIRYLDIEIELPLTHGVCE